MAAMLTVLSTAFPFFALVLCGYLAARRRLLPMASIAGMNSFVLYFALPCMLYRFGAATPIVQLLDPGVFGVYLLCALIMVGVATAMSLNHRIGWNDAAFGALVAAFPNTGFMGVPLLLALLGPRSSGPVIVTIVVDMLFTSSLCIALSRVGAAGGARVAVGQALKGMAGNPMPWSIVLGALASALGWALPKPLQQSVGLLADAASPVALFTIGAILARGQMTADEVTALPAPMMDYVPLALKKLILHPLLVFCIGHAAIKLEVPLDPFALTVMVLVACLPSASNVTLLSERFGASTARIARIILVSTALSFVTFSAAVSWLT